MARMGRLGAGRYQVKNICGSCPRRLKLLRVANLSDMRKGQGATHSSAEGVSLIPLSLRTIVAMKLNNKYFRARLLRGSLSIISVPGRCLSPIIRQDRASISTCDFAVRYRTAAIGDQGPVGP
jgi:hypothetical protein